MGPDRGVDGIEYFFHVAVHVVTDEGNEMSQDFFYDSVVSEQCMASG
jgi:hypothetical protein